MAVQAQYPSNVLLLNRNGQEGLDYSLQPQPGGFLDQSPMVFVNGGADNSTAHNSNTRKRAREAAGGGGMSSATGLNQFSIHQQQQQPPQASQLIELSQLHNHQSQPNVVSTGLRLAFGGGDQQIQQNQNRHFQLHQQNQNTFPCQSTAILSLLSEDFTGQIKRQRDEIDQFLLAQGEHLRRALAEKRNRHYRALITAAEESIGRKLREKEAEVEKVARCNAELEARAAQLSVEAQVWQAKARAQEATAAALQGQLQQVIMNVGVPQDSRRGDDGGGVGSSGGGGGAEGKAEDAESAYVDPERVTAMGGPSCKGCRKRAATVVVLPCRHLCLCTECDRVAQACPLCLQVRNSSVEVFLY